MTLNRRSFLLRAGGAGLGLAVAGSLPAVVSATPAAARPRHGWSGYGPLVTDPAGIVDLPEGFRYRVFSRTGDALDGGLAVPGSHDGMAAFHGRGHQTLLVRNHEIDVDDVTDDGTAPVPHVAGRTYDLNGTGGTTTLRVSGDRKLLGHEVSLAGTVNNCAGGPTPSGTWLTCEETDVVIDGVRHGYVFEVDPVRGGNPVPIAAMGRFEHEAVSFDRRRRAYLTEDADGPFGGFYRFEPNAPWGGRGTMHRGGALSAMRVPALGGADLSSVTEAGITFGDLEWLPVPQPDPGEDDLPVRDSVDLTHIPKCEGTWEGDGAVWFVSSRGDGVHGGQIWRYDPRRNTLRLVVVFSPTDDYEGPDNITVSPYGYAVMCTDGEDDRQFLAGITPEGRTFPLALNTLSDEEFAGATFSPDGRTLFANIQDPGLTLAIWGPWHPGHGR